MAENEGVEPVENDQQDQNNQHGESEQDSQRAGGSDALKADLARERKARQKLERDLETVRKQSMSDAEKAIAEAEERGKTAGRSEGLHRVARSDFAAAAARRNPDFDASEALEFMDLSKFFDEAGEINQKALSAAVTRLVPESTSPRPRGDVGQGPRQTSKSGEFNGNDFLREYAGR